MNTDDPIKPILEAARKQSPFGDAGDFGFETRLRAMLRANPLGGSLTVTDWIARFSWRFSVACLPVLLALAYFLAFQQHGQLPEGISGFVTNWSQYLPVDI